MQAQLDQLQKENSNFKDLTSRYGKALLQASEQPGADDKEQVVEGDGEHCAYVRDGPLLLDGLDVSCKSFFKVHFLSSHAKQLNN